ncbi:cupin domain-containing protein [Kribbella shirazensis]|uniref:Mannose-6-phosphate isomerase-like protein (Cupin superfamily) n=1 Tax=Kribbella shirazensis TaxID=1105143 RepID=A0A7X6A1A4_9ACTN|nr:cupin domain-containing protein [Kribbella shirazensis]NIK57635.1 mannose-6-phosphate isomerase-like protein (cupin superfamily) [Kribbella shirazensis]
MHVIHADEAPRFQLQGVEFTGLAAPSRGSAGLCTWRLTVPPGHGADAPHTLDRDEVFMVLSGTVQLAPDGDKLGAGDAVVVPAGEPIALTNLGEDKAELIVAITAGFTGYLADGTAIQPPWAQ